MGKIIVLAGLHLKNLKMRFLVGKPTAMAWRVAAAALRAAKDAARE